MAHANVNMTIKVNVFVDDYEAIRRARVAEAKSRGDYYRLLARHPVRKYTEEQARAWLFASSPDVVRIVESVARRVAREYAEAIEPEDLAAEAMIVLVERHEEMVEAFEEGPAMLTTRLYNILRNFPKTEYRRRKSQDSWEALVEEGLVG